MFGNTAYTFNYVDHADINRYGPQKIIDSNSVMYYQFFDASIELPSEISEKILSYGGTKRRRKRRKSRKLKRH